MSTSARKRADKPFISVNCAAIPENLLESELFGHEKGAFTGAVARRIGKFEEADGGTLLLDEISEMDIRLQAKLLRAIQEREIDRVGGAKPVPVNIRIIATSNRILQEAVIRGEFRKDLLYRLNVMNLHIPPLRERPHDLLALADYFVEKYATANGFVRTPVGSRARAHPVRRLARQRPRTRERDASRRHPGATARKSRSTTCARPMAARFRPTRSTPRPSARSTPPKPPSRARRMRVGQTVAEVEQDLILLDARPLPRQPHARRQHSRHLDPHAAQQAARLSGRRRRSRRAGRSPGGRVS